MAIQGQGNIRIGNVNSPVNSDSLFAAFTTIQNNFTTLFTTAGPVTALIAGNGVSVNANSSTNITRIDNTGVTRLLAGTGVVLSGANGEVTISSTGGGSNGNGTVQSVGVTSNTLTVTNSPIISSGDIRVELPNTGVTTGTYSNPNVTVDAKGRVTAIANGTASGVSSVVVTGNNGITVTPTGTNNAPVFTVTNSGVTGIVAGTGISISPLGGTGVVTINSTGGNGGGGGTVTSVGVIAGSNNLTVSGGPIVNSGNITVNLASNISVNSANANTANIFTILSNAIYANSSNASVPHITATFFGSNSEPQSWYVGARARGTQASPATAQINDTLTRWQSYAYTPFNIWQSGAGISVGYHSNPANATAMVPSNVYISSVSVSNIMHQMILSHSGNTKLPGTTTNTVFSNVAAVNSRVVARARGVDGTPAVIQSGDTIDRQQFYGYTGNGVTEIWKTLGYSFSSSITVVATDVPAVSGGYIPSEIQIRTVTTSNNVITSTFTNTGNLSIPGIYVGNGSGLTSLTGSNVTGQVANALVSGTVYTAAQPNITSAVNLTSVGTLTGLAVNGTVTAVNITANTGVFTGNGSGLSAITGGNVTGIVANATRAVTAGSADNGVVTTGTYANPSWITSLAGTKITGAVALATSATTANAVAGANVTGQVTFAGTANSVAGANVSGTVANATFAISAGDAANASNLAGSITTGTGTVGNLVTVTINGVSVQLLAR